ncbi:hypothetical protein PHYPO_G00148480 [Pangasianodon hypophthalmus]|uniref:Uncharacterized protein n=1 Tax=Pangasianodon hypophthalmus TaxID=310915 RepID=A0A5N5K9B3_PANHP|nr:hypothetical protein PHYPO_G00148480 [Pangasianodon hypophthalmus]
MSARLTTLSSALYLNSTNKDSESRDVVYECKVFNISMLALSVCILTVTAIACCVSYLNRCRHRKRAGEYESAVACDLEEEPVNLKVVQRSQSLHNPLPLIRSPESFRKDDSSIYYIYANPLPVGCHDDDDDVVHPRHTTLPPTDPKDGIILDPPSFYMQL